MFRTIAVAALLFGTTAAMSAEHAARERHFNVYVSSGRSIQNWHGQATVDSLTLEWARNVTPRLELALAAATSAVDQPKSWFGDLYGDGNEVVRAGSLSFLGRYSFRPESMRVNPYVEIGTGPMWANRRVPAATSHFNFATQFGAGVVLSPRGRVSLIVGYRFSHISNGGYAPRNPGWNVNSVLVGTSFNAWN